MEHFLRRHGHRIDDSAVVRALTDGGSLNFYANLVADSGFGKGRSTKVARDLLGLPVTLRGVPSSGEGLRDMLLPDEMGYVEPVLLNCAEIDSLTSAAGRSGSTVIPTLRLAWEGTWIDFVTRSTAKKTSAVSEHTYRLCMIAGVQPGRGRMLIEDLEGTAQRFVWFPAVDLRAHSRTRTTTATPATG